MGIMSNATYYITKEDLENEILEIPEGAKSVTNYCDEEYNKANSNVKKIICPSTLEKIESRCFSYFQKLEEVKLNKGIKEIGGHAFCECKNLNKINFPGSLQTIFVRAFYNCRKLKNVELINLEKIYGSAFRNTNIKYVHLGKNLFYLDERAFSNCNIKIITVDQENPTYDSRNDCNAVVYTSTDTILQGCRNTIIPENIKQIASYAFEDIRFVGYDKKIKLPEYVLLRENAFTKCNFDYLDARNVNIQLNQYDNSIWNFIISDNNIYEGMLDAAHNIKIDGTLSNFIENNTEFYEKHKEDKYVKFYTTSLDELIERGYSIKEANKVLKECKDIFR